MMPPPLHLPDIRCKWFPYRLCDGKQKGAMNEWYLRQLLKDIIIIIIIYFKSGSKAHKKQWTVDRQEYTEYVVYI